MANTKAKTTTTTRTKATPKLEVVEKGATPAKIGKAQRVKLVKAFAEANGGSGINSAFDCEGDFSPYRWTAKNSSVWNKGNSKSYSRDDKESLSQFIGRVGDKFKGMPLEVQREIYNFALNNPYKLREEDKGTIVLHRSGEGSGAFYTGKKAEKKNKK